MSGKTCAFLTAHGHFDLLEMNLAWKKERPRTQSPPLCPLLPPQGGEPPGTHQARQDGSQPHVSAVTGVIHLVDELVGGPDVAAHALQRVHAVREGGDIWGASKLP